MQVMQKTSDKAQKQITKLQRQIAQFQKQLTIEAKEQDLIKNYKMTEGDYQILITIYEANDLMPRGTDFWIFKTDKTACDAFVEIQIKDQIQRTSVKNDTNNPIFDEKFYFKFPAVTLEELDRSSISFKLYDKKRFLLRDSLIGSFQLDWTNVYFKRNHQIYRGWLTLMDPFDQEQGIMGYLMVSVAVLGPKDKVTVHDSAFIKDPLTTIQDTITMPKLQLIDYGINIQIYRAQNLIPLDQFAGNVDAYIIAKFSGNKIDSSVKTSCNPQWDQLLRIGTAVPTKSKYITIEVRNRNYMFGDDIIGTLKIPFIDLKNDSEPRWGHLYGPPVSGKDIEPYNFATKMQVYGQELGSHYRGRLLYRITGQKDIINKNSRSKISFKFPFKPTPVVPLKSYTLRLQVLDGFNLPQIKDKKQCYLHCCIGQYMLVSKSFGQLKNHSSSFYQRMPDKKIQFPEDVTQIPDLIIYLANGERQKDRISYVRIPAQNILSSNNINAMTIYNLKADLSLKNFKKDESGGSITARAHLFTGQPPQSKQTLLYEFGKKAQFILKIFVYRARNLPPMNETGDCDPKLLFHFCGAQKQISQKSTYNPIWNQVIDIEIDTEDFMSINIEKALICNVFDTEENTRDNLIGNFMIKLSKVHKRRYQGFRKKFDFLYQKPQWYPIINQKVDIGDPCQGHVLVGCAVFRKSDMSQFNHRQIVMKKQICESKNFQIYLLGARGLEAAAQYLNNKQLLFQIKIGQQTPIKSKAVDVKQHSANFNQMISFTAEVPKNKGIVPFVQIKLYQTTNSIQKFRFIGFSSISLYDLVPKIQQRQHKRMNQEQYDSEQTLLDIEELDEQLNVVRERKRLRMELLNQEKQQNKKQTGIQLIPVPKQMAGSTNDESVDRNARLDQLLSNAEQMYKIDPQYQHVKQQAQKKDRETFLRLKSQSNFSHNDNIFQRSHEDENQQQSLYRQQDSQKAFRISKPNRQSGFLDLLIPKHDKIKGDQDQNRMTKTNIIRSQKYHIEDEDNNLLNFVQKQTSYNNGQQSKRDHFVQMKNRFQIDTDEKRKNLTNFLSNNKELSENKTVKNFDLDVNQDIPEVQHDQRAIKYKDLERIIKEQQKFTKQAMQRQENYKYAAAVKLSLFKWKRAKKTVERETYQDYDTDPEQSLDIIPQWYKGRKILATDFEQLVPNDKIKSLPIYQGGQRKANLDIRQKKMVGKIKCIGLVTEQDIEEKQKQYIRLLKPKSYVCRIYILKGKSLISSFSKKPTTYLRISCKGDVIDLKQTTLKKEDYNPQFYICQEIPMDIPGPSTVKIQVMEQVSTFGISQTRVLGYTEIDVQARHFTKKWHLFTQKKPIQLRNLYSQYGNGTQGRLQVWTDIIKKKNWLSNPPFKIHPPPFDKYQLRIIVWSTKECVVKNQAFQSNDVFVRGFLGTSQAQETDTHWACRSVGNFNYRFKFEVSYPPKPEDMYSDQFIIQIWDRDVVGYNNLIGQKRINLNKIHRIIQKVVKRKKPVKAKMKIREKGLALTQKFWFDVYNHKVKDQFGQLESQGKVQLSFQLIPKQAADQTLKNGYGRSQPNIFPTLPQPAGRLNFNILHPLQFFKQLCGPDLYNSICHKMICCFIILLIVVLLYFIGGSLITAAMVRSSNNSNNNNNNNSNNSNNGTVRTAANNFNNN